MRKIIVRCETEDKADEVITALYKIGVGFHVLGIETAETEMIADKPKFHLTEKKDELPVKIYHRQKHNNNKVWKESELKKVRKQLSDGVSLKKIAKEFGRSIGSINFLRIKFGFTSRHRRPKKVINWKKSRIRMKAILSSANVLMKKGFNRSSAMKLSADNYDHPKSNKKV